MIDVTFYSQRSTEKGTVQLKRFEQLPFCPAIGSSVGFDEGSEFNCDDYLIQDVMWNIPENRLLVEINDPGLDDLKTAFWMIDHGWEVHLGIEPSDLEEAQAWASDHEEDAILLGKTYFICSKADIACLDHAKIEYRNIGHVVRS